MKTNLPLILIIAHTHPWLIEAFEAKGYQVIYDKNMNYLDAQTHIIEAEGIVAGNRWPIDKRLISAGSQLKWIGRLGSGMEKIDVAFAEANGIKCYSSPEGNRKAVAEHALGLLLGLSHHIVKAHNEVVHGKWLRDENRGMEITGKTIGIIGFGNTGKSFAKVLGGFGVTILANDIKPVEITENITEASIAKIQEEADIISFHVPLNAVTLKMGNDAFFAACKKQPIIINTSRGEVIDGFALKNALENSLISGAALDVLENENMANLTTEEKVWFNYLINAENVILTPHIAGYTQESLLKMAQVLFEKIKA